MSKSKFGFDKVETVTVSVLKSRIAFLERGIDSGRWDRDPDKRFAAIKTAAYYRWQLTHDPRFVKRTKVKTNKRKAA